jgi:accessory colonization factor AcfC
MPKFNVEESIFVDVPVEKAYATVKDFKSWSIWSPWTIADPESKRVSKNSDFMIF